MNFPEIVDIALPAEGVFHNLAFVSIRKTDSMQAYTITHGLVGTLSTASDTDQGRSGMRPYRR